MAEGRNHKLPERRWLTLSRWLALSALGLGVLLLTALLRGTPEDIGWYLWHVLPAVAVVALCATTVGRLVTTVALITYAAALPLLTLLVGVGAIDPWHDGVRLQLFTDNPNLLGADLVAVTLAAMVVRPRLPWAFWLPLVALAVVFTGSRTGLFALGLASSIWLFSPWLRFRSRLILLGGAVVVALVLAGASSQYRLEDASANLLRVSTTFSDPSWNTRFAASFSVERHATRGPIAGTTAERLTASTSDHVLTVHQSGERSVAGTAYVASVYLRSDTPQRVVLSSHLSRTTCDVRDEWQRCFTPPGVGDGRLMAQFRLEVQDAGDGFDLFAFGPQLERSYSPTAYSATGVAPLPRQLIDRFVVPSRDQWLPDPRWQAMTDAYAVFLMSPWVGVGQAPLASFFSIDNAATPVPTAHHAHNLFLHRLAADGLLGALAWLLLVAPLIYALVVHARLVGFPWLVGIVTLNLVDMTIFHSGSYFGAAIACGVMAGMFWQRSTRLATEG